MTSETNTTPAFGEALETFLPTGKLDVAGRHIGFIVGLNDNGVDFHAWVQNARSAKGFPFADMKDFGVRQRSKRFGSQVEATAWAYRTAKERTAKL